MQPLAQMLLAHVRRQEFIAPGNRVGVAVSGGLDSVALLRLLLELRAELGAVFSVVHFNHKLRGSESDGDEAFVQTLAAAHGLDFHVSSADVARHAAEEHMSIEAAARRARYDFFATLLTASPETRLHKIATAHTLDDQAETVLMRVVRGTGLRGLGGIHPRLTLASDDDEDESGEVVRPLLATRRRELKSYLESIQQPWREDSSNSDVHFTRNRLRHRVMPILEKEFNPNIAKNLSELADLARAEQDYWDSETEGWMGTVVQWDEPASTSTQSSSLVQISPSDEQPTDEPSLAASISRPWLLSEPLAVQRRLLKSVADQAEIPLEFKHVEEILQFAADAGHAGKQLTLPLGWTLVREPESIVFEPPAPSDASVLADYDFPFPIPGVVTLPELRISIEATLIESTANFTMQPTATLLKPGIRTSSLTLRNWRPGDRFWPAHTSGPHKVKELLQERHIPSTQRKLWPVIVRGDEIIWLRGFPAHGALTADATGPAILIRELPAGEDHEI